MEEGDTTNWTRGRVVSAIVMTVLLTAVLAAVAVMNAS